MSGRATRAQRVLLVAVALISAAVACGGSDDEAVTTTTTATPPTTTPVTTSIVPGTEPGGEAAFLGPISAIPAGDIEIGYRRFGSGPPLVLIMGFSGAQTLWPAPWLERLAEDFTVITFDNRGVGATTNPGDEPFTHVTMAEDTANLIRALGYDRAHVLGWSMGGEIALTMGWSQPDVLDRVVVIGADTGGPVAVQPSPQVTDELNDPNTGPIELLDLIFPQQAVEAKRAFAEAYEDQPQEQITPEALSLQVQAENEYADSDRYPMRLTEMVAPLLAIAGTEDIVVPPENAALVVERVEGAEQLLVPGAGHAVAFQDVEGVLGAIRSHLLGDG